MAALIASLFGSIASFFGLWLTKKAALAAAAVAVFGTLTVALLALISASISSLLTLPTLPGAVVFGFWYFMPSMFPTCVSIILSAQGAATLYAWNVKNLHYVVSAS